MRRSVTGLQRYLFRLPIGVFRARLGWLFGGALLMLTHTGRKTGKPRRTILEVPLRDDARVLYVASGWGPGVDWYRNLAADPHVDVMVGARQFAAIAEPLTPPESGALMSRYAREHPKRAAALAKIVEWSEEDATDWYQVGHDRVPWVRLTAAPT